MAKELPATKMGRPRGFEENAALDAAARVFWEKGFEGATLSDLECATGINRSSMFAAFGNKEALFKLAWDRYMDTELSYVKEAFEKPTLHEFIEFSLHATVAHLSNPKNPGGCLSVHGALATGDEGSRVKQWIIEARKRGHLLIKKRFEQARASGEIKKDIDPDGFARLFSTLIQGLGVQAASGATKSDLNKTIRVALQLMGY